MHPVSVLLSLVLAQGALDKCPAPGTPDPATPQTQHRLSTPPHPSSFGAQGLPWGLRGAGLPARPGQVRGPLWAGLRWGGAIPRHNDEEVQPVPRVAQVALLPEQIGRASCRERVSSPV